MELKAAASTVGHDHHRIRKGYFKNFFSRRAVESLGGFIQESIDLLCELLTQMHRDDVPAHLDSLYAKMTADIITYYTIGECSNELRRNDETDDIT